jgi:hypothetical protein
MISGIFKVAVDVRGKVHNADIFNLQTFVAKIEKSMVGFL